MQTECFLQSVHSNYASAGLLHALKSEQAHALPHVNPEVKGKVNIRLIQFLQQNQKQMFGKCVVSHV